MMEKFNFGTASIYELGEKMSEMLKRYGVDSDTSVEITLKSDEFRKVDEDLFYRNRKDEDEKFVPSEGEINVRVENIIIIIKESAEKQ